MSVVDRTVVQTQKLCGTSGQNPHLAFSGVDDEVGGMYITTGSGGIAKGTVASSAGESDFLGTSSKEGLSSIDMRQQLILPAAEAEEVAGQRPPRNCLVLMLTVTDLAVQELETDTATATPSKKRGTRSPSTLLTTRRFRLYQKKKKSLKSDFFALLQEWRKKPQIDSTSTRADF